MKTVAIKSFKNLPKDTLEITGVVTTETAQKEVVVKGWTSATTNFYPADAFDSKGDHKAGVAGRLMTPSEKIAWALRLLQQQYPEVSGCTFVPDVPPAPVPPEWETARAGAPRVAKDGVVSQPFTVKHNGVAKTSFNAVGKTIAELKASRDERLVETKAAVLAQEQAEALVASL